MTYNRSYASAQPSLNRNGQIVSSVIKNIQVLNGSTGSVLVTLVSGAMYLYTEMPNAVIGALFSAASLGQYWSRFIVGRYNEQRVQTLSDIYVVTL